MDGFWKAAAVIVLTIVLGAAIGKMEKDIFVVLTATACCIVGLMALHYFSEVICFLEELGNRLRFQNPFFNMLLRIAGVALTTELIAAVSADAGNSSLGKAMQILGNTVILFLSIPLFEAFFSTLEEILGFL